MRGPGHDLSETCRPTNRGDAESGAEPREPAYRRLHEVIPGPTTEPGTERVRRNAGGERPIDANRQRCLDSHGARQHVAQLQGTSVAPGHDLPTDLVVQQLKLGESCLLWCLLSKARQVLRYLASD